MSFIASDRVIQRVNGNGAKRQARRRPTTDMTPSPKTEPRNVRESSRPAVPERILYEEATQWGADRSDLRQADVALGKGQKVPEVCKQLGISEQTCYRWRTKYGGMDPQMARQLQELKKENARLKRW
jgi:hypothetical protein